MTAPELTAFRFVGSRGIVSLRKAQNLKNVELTIRERSGAKSLITTLKEIAGTVTDLMLGFQWGYSYTDRTFPKELQKK